MPQLRAIVAADSALLRAGLARLLEDAGVAVVARAASAGELIREAPRADVAIVSLAHPPRRDQLRGLAVLVLARAVDERAAVALLEPGAHGVGYLVEDRVRDVASFVAAVREVARGGSVLDAPVLAQVLGTRRDVFTRREREVLELMAQGRSNRGIAHATHVSERAVERHVTAIFGKLRLPPGGRTHRRVLAVRAHLQA